jgi:DNA polymerase III alpha subunit
MTTSSGITEFVRAFSVTPGNLANMQRNFHQETAKASADGVTVANHRSEGRGIIVQARLHHQSDGRIMKFISVCDYSGMLECELFARAYRTFGAETIRYPVVEVSGKVKPFANSNGYTLQVEAVRRARTLR